MTLQIGNMPLSMNEADLRDLFSRHGLVASASVTTDRNTGRSRGFGFVKMGYDEARKAMSALNEREIDGRRITVVEASPRRQAGRE